MLKLADNPPTIWPEAGGLTHCPGRWWVAHTRPRCEKAFAWDLLDRGIAYFLPMCRRTRISGGRRRTALIPLFPSYVFFCGREGDRHAALRTDRLCRAIDVADQEGLLRELTEIERALDGGAELDLHPHTAVGSRCRVRSGPLQGVEGVVVSRNRRARVVLEVSVLACGAAMEIDADLLEAAE
jgi:hypothetical protein